MINDKLFLLLSYICSENANLVMKILLLTVTLLLVAVVMLGCKVLFIKGAKFPSQHAHDIAIPHRNPKIQNLKKINNK